MKHYLTIAAIVIVILGLGAFVYFYFATSPSVTVTPGGTTSLPIAGQTPGAASGGGAGSGTQTISSPGTPVIVSSRLVQVSAGPVVPGEIAYDRKVTVGSSTRLVASVQYIERQSGNVFSYQTDTHTLTRVNNKTLPGIQSAVWLPDASMSFVRYLSGTDFTTVNTYALGSTSPNGFFLPQNLSDVAVSSTTVLSLASGVNGSIASLSRTDGTHASTVFTTPLTSLRVMFAGKNQYLAFSKPSSTLDGDAFLVNSSGRFSRIAGPLSGLVALASPSGKWALVSYTQGDTLQTELVNVATGETTVLPVGTIADKCVWTADETSVYCGIPQNPPAASYPDDWYQGAVTFSDRIWNIHVNDRFAQMVLDFSQANRGALDATALTVDPAKTTLVFMNKNDETLWSYSL
jgi:hypothetical protein